MTTPGQTPQVRHNEAERRFEAGTPGGVAIVQYLRRGDRIVFTHTEVPPAMRGQGIGEHVAETALEFAEREHLTVEPKCEFIAAYIERHPRYRALTGERPTPDGQTSE